jgi:hypothetical protein
MDAGAVPRLLPVAAGALDLPTRMAFCVTYLQIMFDASAIDTNLMIVLETLAVVRPVSALLAALFPLGKGLIGKPFSGAVLGRASR